MRDFLNTRSSSLFDRTGKTAGSSSNVATAVTSEHHRQSRRVGTGLIFAREYYPRRPFRILGRLPATLTVKILDGPPGRTIPVLTQPDEYNGYVIQYASEYASTYTFLFSQHLLESAAEYRLTLAATYFSSLLNLLEVPLVRIGDRG